MPERMCGPFQRMLDSVPGTRSTRSRVSRLAPSDWKPMPAVGAGVREIRVHTRLEHRVVYIAKFREAVYILHAFSKKTRRTPRRDIDLARLRLRDVLGARPGARGLRRRE